MHLGNYKYFFILFLAVHQIVFWHFCSNFHLLYLNCCILRCYSGNCFDGVYDELYDENF